MHTWKLRLYDFCNWNSDKHVTRLVELDSGETLFKKEFLKIEEDWTIIDVGARVGFYTIMAGLGLGKTRGKVLAIEAHPEIYRVLKTNIALYKLGNVIPVCKAVGCETRMVRLYESYDSGGTSIYANASLRSFAGSHDWSRMKRWFRLLQKREIGRLMKALVMGKVLPGVYVPMDTLDNIASEKGLTRIDLIKIDVQGAELDVLKGSRHILESHKPTVLVEVHPPVVQLKSLCELLSGYGYNLTTGNRFMNPMVVAHAA